jgi:hypothetical protein
MEIPVKEIEQIITSFDISDIKAILYKNQEIVENRIQELMKLKKRINKAAIQYELCEKLAGKFQFVAAPQFKYKLVSGQAEDLVALISKYKKEDWVNDRIQYTLLVSKEELLNNPNFCSAQIGIGVEEENLHVLEAEQNELYSFNEAEYLYTVIGTNYSEPSNAMLNKALHYLTEIGRKISGPLIGRYIASNHKDGLDYYEVWISIE